jgi:glutamate formiminotransferase / formiminotetrahydrofolate cyclodeaminase
VNTLIECVPNISEGRDEHKIARIVSSISGIDGIQVLNIESGFDANRTVVTFVGPPAKVQTAVFKLVKKATELLDMSNHSGAHPRIGAVDVCPLIPLQRATMENCVRLAKMLGEKVGEELGIPVYLYGNAARQKYRSNLADIRRGEYEGLAEKMSNPLWKPDFGPAKFNRLSGAIAIGARPILIAFNINLKTRDVRIAQKIAGYLRTSGFKSKSKNGQFVKKPGLFRECKAIGWYMDKYKIAQVSFNLTDYTITPPHVVYEACKNLALKEDVMVAGSELVGMIPLDALLNAGRYYAKLEQIDMVSEEKLINIAVQKLGLEELAPFDKEFKIIEYGLRRI